jgi:CspA family cold shock protein
MPEMGDSFGGDRDRDRGGHGGGQGPGGGHGGGYRGGEGRPQHQEREKRPAGPRQNGVLKFFNTERGFGFITPDDGNKDVFVHISAIERSGLPQLEEGTRVSFETEEDRRGRGFQAVNLQLIED